MVVSTNRVIGCALNAAPAEWDHASPNREKFVRSSSGNPFTSPDAQPGRAANLRPGGSVPHSAARVVARWPDDGHDPDHLAAGALNAMRRLACEPARDSSHPAPVPLATRHDVAYT